VIRKPETYEDRVHNCHNVIEALGGIAINAEQICQGDFNAIAALITVFSDLCPPESPSASESAQEWGRNAGGRTSRAEQASPSIGHPAPGQHVQQEWRPWSGEDAPEDPRILLRGCAGGSSCEDAPEGPVEPIDQGADPAITFSTTIQPPYSHHTDITVY
jgi:hypothetical protein